MPIQLFSMKTIAPTAAAVLGIDCPAAAAETPIGPITKDLKGARRLAILAPDALGILPWRLWKDRMPFMSSLHEKRSILLESIMPSVTPVNFACMLTGAELDVHGVRTREMDFRCETLFDVIRRSGGTCAGAGQRGATGERLLARCADFGWVAEPGSAAAVGDAIMENFQSHMPSFLIAQFANVDSTFHKLGPSNPEVVPMLIELETVLSKLIACLTDLDTDIILLADHGQHDAIDPPEGSDRGRHGTDMDEDRLVPCTWIQARTF